MPRVIDVTVPSAQTDRLVESLRRRDEVLGLSVQPGASIKPPGDVITISTTNRSMHELVRLLDAHGIGAASGTSLSSSEPVALVVPSAREWLGEDASEGTWEEVDTVIGKESNPTANSLAVMAISGAVAAVGLATNALHLVIAAMVIAPGFEPFLRISLGLIIRTTAWRRGILQTAKTYAAFLVGAMVSALVMRAIGTPPLGEKPTYLESEVLVNYWTTVSASGVLVSAVASMAGAILVVANRSVLTAGVMIALALVPGAAIAMSGLAAGDASIAGRGALRWLIDAVLVVGVSALVFAWKQTRVHRRQGLL